jgi:hypothetical protein
MLWSACHILRMALGALIIKARLRITDEELVEQNMENPYLQFFIGLETFQSYAPFDPLMIVYFRKRLPESVLNDCNKPIVHPAIRDHSLLTLSVLRLTFAIRLIFLC